MTWEADIVDRAGRRSISGEFRLTSDGEAAKFIAELKALVAKANLDRVNRRPESASQYPKHTEKKEPEVVVELISIETSNRSAEKFPPNLPELIRLNGGERKVFELVNRGLTAKQISDKTRLTEKSVNNYIYNMRCKLREARS